jgi:hypothetical protein
MKVLITNIKTKIQINQKSKFSSLFFKNFGAKSNFDKSIFRKKNSPYVNENTIDITESQKEFEINQKIEMKKMEM